VWGVGCGVGGGEGVGVVDGGEDCAVEEGVVSLVGGECGCLEEGAVEGFLEVGYCLWVGGLEWEGGVVGVGVGEEGLCLGLECVEEGSDGS